MQNQLLRRMTVTSALFLVLFIGFLVSSSQGCSSDQNGCKECILNQFKCDCPECQPVLRCLAGCLWEGIPRSKCVSTCDSHKGKPRLSDCKNCMRECKCSCVGGGKKGSV
ncbi:hypothetical protein H6P81_008059 [Aristolochia fimbriata]|uniref:Uncharacterized protein n=1 Tax=Aristolochia fimbriata TaxID=158543 RepID=A0AAV7F4A4_ARIFI|nr:hypothetical protein H6P81_008059 [Aristolochia fimbriata]